MARPKSIWSIAQQLQQSHHMIVDRICRDGVITPQEYREEREAREAARLAVGLARRRGDVINMLTGDVEIGGPAVVTRTQLAKVPTSIFDLPLEAA